MVAKISREVLESYLNCRYKGHLKLAGQQGTRSAYELLRAEMTERVRQAATEKLLTKNGGEVLRGLTITPEVIRLGARLLLAATVESEGISVHFDGLQSTNGSRDADGYHYVPILFDPGEKPGGFQRALLELLGLILGAVQGKEPTWGILIHGRNCEVRKIKLGSGVANARRALQEVREIQAAGTPPRLLLNSHCQVCEFRRRCHAEATVKDDLSLLRGMGQKEVIKFGRRGIFTVTQLSCTFRPRKMTTRREDGMPPHHHALQALAIRDKKIYVLGTPDLRVSAARIYFDIEGNPERGFAYLLGLIVEAGGVEERFSFWADTAADEGRIFQQFLDVVGRHMDACLYCYGSYETAFLRRLAKGSGREELVANILARSVNVLSVIYSHVYFPVYHNGLKDVGGQLGFHWTEASASGIQSIVWRTRWEETGTAEWKEKLTAYNMEDCVALKKVTQFLYAICPGQPAASGGDADCRDGQEVSRVEDVPPQWKRRDWCMINFALPDFEFVNARAYFDYQRDKVFIRTSKLLRKSRRQERRKKGKKNLRANRKVVINSPECPFCKGTDLTLKPDGRLVRLGYDLRMTRGSVRRWVIQFNTAWHHCGSCHKRFLPEDYLRLAEHFHSLKGWAMFEHVAHRTSLANIAETIRECFGLPVYTPDVFDFKKALAYYYEGTYKRILEKIVAGALIHADETEIHVRKLGKGYVWVFTNLEEVVFVYRKSREGDFLHDLLKGFRGVLISDFYTAYDSLDCPQQKCLIHLIRDFNEDIRANAWDEELRSLAAEFGELLRAIVAAVDRHGLRQSHLSRHKRRVDRFFESLETKTYRSEVAEGYQKRLLKYRTKLFTFLDHDNVPWNNNNAEHAIKQFAYYREYADGLIVETGLNEYLVLLSVYLTCKYKGVSFLKFLVSRQTDIDAFCAGGRRQSAPPPTELHPEGWISTRCSRRKTTTKAAVENCDTTCPEYPVESSNA